MPRRRPEVFYIKQGDTGPMIQEELIDDQPEGAWDLVGASVRFHLATESDGTGAVVVDGTATVIDAPERLVGYDWQVGDTDALEGTYYAEWEATLSDGKVRTFPSRDELNTRVVVSPDLA